MDPADTRVLDNVVRFIGQKVAAVVAETEAAAEEACRRIVVDYELLPAVFDGAKAISPGAPVLHDKGAESRIANAARNIVAEVHGEIGNVDAAFASSALAPYSAAAAKTSVPRRLRIATSVRQGDRTS